jgi:hypothetical protein
MPSMTDRPSLTPAKQQAHAARAERLSKALRDNLHRRKEQARGRREPTDPAPAGEAVDATPVSGGSKPPA